MSTTRSLSALFRPWPAVLGRAVAMVFVASAPSCFDGEELTDGLKCLQNSHCGGDLQCINGLCMDPNDMGCDTDPSACGMPGTLTTTPQVDDGGSGGADDASASVSATMSTTSGDPAACGGQFESCYESGCCDFGLCVDYGNGTATCQEQCNIGNDCGTCCCIQLESGDKACVDTQYCGQEAQCLGGCASPGAACYGDYDCCGGGRCLLNAGNWYSCFKPCTSPGECVSGCCNYNASIGSSICEAC